MKLTIFTADCTGDAANCRYPHKVDVTSAAELAEAVAYDHVSARYMNDYRSNDNFMEATVIEMDCDNDHSEDPADWVTPEKLAEDPDLGDVEFATTPSRHNMLPKGKLSARPRFHFHATISKCTSAAKVAAIKKALHRKYPFFDGKALDAGRFMFGSAVSEDEVFWHEGFLTVDEIVSDLDFVPEDDDDPALAANGSIMEGARNNTMSHFAGRVLKKYGVCDKAYSLFLERAAKCDPPLPTPELNTIWKSAVKFAQKVQADPAYIPPDKFNDEFGNGRLKPEDYSDIGEARVLAAECAGTLKYTSATDYLAFGGDRWYENREKSLGIVEDFLDAQLSDSQEAIAAAEDALIALGVSEETVKGHGKELAKEVPEDKLGLLYALLGALTYQKFVMKYRNYKNIVNTMNAARPMLAIDVSELDYDAELLNTPAGTYDLSKGLVGCSPHDPDDLITKITGCAPGDKGIELWLDTLHLFFCGDEELIEYVQRIVGQAAVGRVHEEHMIIAYGGGANGKSTFWNTIARVLGNYSGKISAEALTMNCKRNVKPEMAELKGKRLIIASELEEGTRLNTGMVKQLCSTDPIQAEKKYKDPFSFDPSHTLVLYTNHLPKVSANDDGTWRRLIVIPFNAKITGKSDIKNFADHLYAESGGAIMKWVIEGAAKAIASDFHTRKPKIVVDAIEAYREENDWLAQFLDDHCEIDPSYTEKSGELYQTYRNVCMANGEYVRSTTDFYGSLEKAGFNRRRVNSGKLVIGLRLKDGQDFLE